MGGRVVVGVWVCGCCGWGLVLVSVSVSVYGGREGRGGCGGSCCCVNDVDRYFVLFFNQRIPRFPSNFEFQFFGKGHNLTSRYEM